MRKAGFVLLLVLMAAILPAVSIAEDENVTVYGEYLTDSDGYNYGVEYFLDSTVSTRVYVVPHIDSRSNVNGDVTSGPVLMQPNEKRVRIGAFMAADQSKPWSVSVSAKWQNAD